jgi:hypothetical protein
MFNKNTKKTEIQGLIFQWNVFVKQILKALIMHLSSINFVSQTWPKVL